MRQSKKKKHKREETTFCFAIKTDVVSDLSGSYLLISTFLMINKRKLWIEGKWSPNC